MNASEGGQRGLIRVTVEAVDGQQVALVFNEGDATRCIYSVPDHNLTPAQSAGILKLRQTAGNHVAFATTAGVVLATIDFTERDDAILSYFEPDGTLLWSTEVRPEHAVPDTPGIVPAKSSKYRWLAVGFIFFLFIAIAIPLVAPVAGSSFVERTGSGLIVAVFASIFFLQAIRRRGG